MRKIALAAAGITCAAVAFAPLAAADPTAGHDAKVNTHTPPMLCEIGSDDADPGIGPNVICQGSFVQAPALGESERFFPDATWGQTRSTSTRAPSDGETSSYTLHRRHVRRHAHSWLTPLGLVGKSTPAVSRELTIRLAQAAR